MFGLDLPQEQEPSDRRNPTPEVLGRAGGWVLVSYVSIRGCKLQAQVFNFAGLGLYRFPLIIQQLLSSFVFSPALSRLKSLF